MKGMKAINKNEKNKNKIESLYIEWFLFCYAHGFIGMVAIVLHVSWGFITSILLFSLKSKKNWIEKSLIFLYNKSIRT